MTKAVVDQLIRNMKLAEMVSKATPWMVEGMGEKVMHVRYVGLTLKDDWLDIFSPKDNLMVKFVIDRSSAFIEYYLANKPPFIKITSSRFSDSDKWETLLGELKRQLKKDKNDSVNHTAGINNLYEFLKPHLK